MDGPPSAHFWSKKLGFQGQKQWPPKFHIKFRNPGPLPYLGNFPKFYQFFWCLPLWMSLGQVKKDQERFQRTKFRRQISPRRIPRPRLPSPRPPQFFPRAPRLSSPVHLVSPMGAALVLVPATSGQPAGGGTGDDWAGERCWWTPQSKYLHSQYLPLSLEMDMQVTKWKVMRIIFSSEYHPDLLARTQWKYI